MLGLLVIVVSAGIGYYFGVWYGIAAFIFLPTIGLTDEAKRMRTSQQTTKPVLKKESEKITDFIDEVLNLIESFGYEKAKASITPERIKPLINSGGDINAKGKKGYTILMIALLGENNSEIIQNLI